MVEKGEWNLIPDAQHGKLQKRQYPYWTGVHSNLTEQSAGAYANGAEARDVLRETRDARDQDNRKRPTQKRRRHTQQRPRCLLLGLDPLLQQLRRHPTRGSPYAARENRRSAPSSGIVIGLAPDLALPTPSRRSDAHGAESRARGATHRTLCTTDSHRESAELCKAAAEDFDAPGSYQKQHQGVGD